MRNGDRFREARCCKYRRWTRLLFSNAAAAGNSSLWLVIERVTSRAHFYLRSTSENTQKQRAWYADGVLPRVERRLRSWNLSTWMLVPRKVVAVVCSSNSKALGMLPRRQVMTATRPGKLHTPLASHAKDVHQLRVQTCFVKRAGINSRAQQNQSDCRRPADGDGNLKQDHHRYAKHAASG
jgi:hypothetical protein